MKPSRVGSRHEIVARQVAWGETRATGSGVRDSAAAGEHRTFEGTARFQPKAILGHGGMGIVYRAFDAEMGRDVALKTLPSLSPSERAQLKEEFRAVAGLTHPNLIELYELVVDEREAFFTMELLEGVDFVTHVRGTRRRGLSPSAALRGAWRDRLQEALGQLIGAMSALHRTGIIHRDIKPSNLVVTPAGRLVLLDFGLAMGLSGRGAEERGKDLAGTLEYMAPEQVWGAALTPAADFYALGATLHEAITGHPPFEGDPGEIAIRKFRLRAEPVSTQVDGVPPALDALITGLLRSDPSLRAGGEDVLRALADLGAPVPESESLMFAAREAPFVGRSAELAELSAAFERTAGGETTLVRIEGPSGIGKTEIVRRFLSDLEASRETLVLRGRCHPQESVPYKAFDGMIDDLARLLGDEPEGSSVWQDNMHSDALLRVFPALSEVPGQRPPSSTPLSLEPQELRRLAFEGLRHLLAALARDRTVVLWMDDIQWGDADSLLLLRDLFLGRAPALFLAAYRSEDLAHSQPLRDLQAIAAERPESCPLVRLSPLDAAAARMLTSSLLGKRAGENEQAITAITAEASGSPFFIAELARSVGTPSPSGGRSVGTPSPSGGRSVGTPSLTPFSGALLPRLSKLRPAERRLLETVSVAGGPIDRSLALEVAGLGESGRPDAVRLSHACLFRTTELNGRPAVETYHDRIREAVLGALEVEKRTRCHLDLATAIRSRPDPDPEALFRHYRGAGRAPEAAHFALAAAERASLALAFDRASELYRHALSLAPGGDDRARTLEKLAENLINAGRGAESPAVFLEAADLRRSEPLVSLGLRRQAAEQLVRTGRVPEGTSVFKDVLRHVGVDLPRSAETATLRSLAGLARLFVRGTSFKQRSAAEIPPAVLERLDARWGACGGLSVMNPPVASALAIEHLLDALGAGEPTRIAYSLFYQSVVHAALGGPLLGRRAATLLRQGDSIAEGIGDRTLAGFGAQARGSVAWQAGRFADALDACNRAVDIYDRDCRGVAWHRVVAENYALSALAFLGDLRTLERRRRASLERAEKSGDSFGAAIFKIGQLNLGRVGADDPEGAIADADSIQADWPLRIYHHTVITAQADLYAARPESALRRIEEAWSGLEKHQILALELPRIELHFLRGLAALGVAAARLRGVPTASRLDTRALDRSIRIIQRSGQPPAPGFAASLTAGAAWIKGNPRASIRALRTAAEAFETADLALYACTARIALGPLTGDTESARTAMDRTAALGVVRPRRMTGLYVPWLPAVMLADPQGPEPPPA